MLYSPPFTSNTANLLVLLTTVGPFPDILLVGRLQQWICTAALPLSLPLPRYLWSVVEHPLARLSARAVAP